MEKKVGTFDVDGLEALRSSTYGNPRRLVEMVDSTTGERFIAKTGTDCSIGYAIQLGSWKFDYHFTTSGAMIITRGEKLK